MKLVMLVLFLLVQVWCHRRDNQSMKASKTEQENVDLLLTGLLHEEVKFQFSEEFTDSMENLKQSFSIIGKNINDSFIPSMNKLSSASDKHFKAMAEAFRQPHIKYTDHSAHSNTNERSHKLPIKSFRINKETDKDDRL